MDIRPIHTEQDHAWALSEAARYFENEPEPHSEDGDRFEILLSLISRYEDGLFPMDDLDPVDALKAFMEMHGKTQADLATLIGSRSRASEILNRKRALSLDMVHKLNCSWGVPAELLIAPYPLAA